MARIVSIKTDEKKFVHAFTLYIVNRNVPGHIQVLHHPIMKIMMLVGNDEFNSGAEEFKLNVQE